MIATRTHLITKALFYSLSVSLVLASVLLTACTTTTSYEKMDKPGAMVCPCCDPTTRRSCR